MKHHFQFWKVSGAVGNSTTHLRGGVCSRFPRRRGGTGTEEGNLSPPAVPESDLGGRGCTRLTPASCPQEGQGCGQSRPRAEGRV